MNKTKYEKGVYVITTHGLRERTVFVAVGDDGNNVFLDINDGSVLTHAHVMTARFICKNIPEYYKEGIIRSIKNTYDYGGELWR